MENGPILEAELLTNWPGIYSGHMEHFVPDTQGDLNNQNEKKQCICMGASEEGAPIHPVYVSLSQAYLQSTLTLEYVTTSLSS